MKKILILFLALVILVSVPTGLALATSDVKNIEFNMSGDFFVRGQGEDGYTDIPFSIQLNGKLREKDDLTYLSPLKGNITMVIEDEEVTQEIHAKPIKESEPAFHFYDSYWPDDYLIVMIELSGQGNKAIGNLFWGHYDPYDESYLNIIGGVVNDMLVSGYAYGPLPTIE